MLRVDFDTPARAALAGYDVFRLGFVEPPGWELFIEKPGAPRPRAQLLHDGLAAEAEPGAPAVEVGVDQILEVAVPFALLAVQADEPLQFYAELLQGGQSRDCKKIAPSLPKSTLSKAVQSNQVQDCKRCNHRERD